MRLRPGANSHVPSSKSALTRTRYGFVLLAVGRGAPPGHSPPSQPLHQARGAHSLLSSIRRLFGRRRAPDPSGLLQRYLRAMRRTRLLQSPWRATPVLHARYFAYGSGLRITGGRSLHPAGQQQLHPRRVAITALSGDETTAANREHNQSGCVCWLQAVQPVIEVRVRWWRGSAA